MAEQPFIIKKGKNNMSQQTSCSHKLYETTESKDKKVENNNQYESVAYSLPTVAEITRMMLGAIVIVNANHITTSERKNFLAIMNQVSGLTHHLG